ncbi:thymidylate synthase [Salmonella enterica subsp. enterica serovar Muenchen]|nr:thymidylate synthase [Salmonella enterica]EBU8844643.1 thymidylate synthase [Salmonella enterica subsp. enterica serovar Muenchen]ECX6011477.1 thymidylate synthase [Salmonella enterica subsp. enterica serovar Rubislaw]EBW2620652.1 thymidylate synthase [Salmonella enterica subsp. enterica serovar Muenchen]EBW3354057.1 thymidylate synthase [Salmonella enterica subsp. enterica serovar Muenchen]
MTNMEIEKNTIDDVMRAVFENILSDGVPVETTRGPTKEILGTHIILNNPICRISRTESRGKIFTCLGELMWYLSGSDDVESIRYYISKYRDSSESDGTINGAYGPRLFGTKNGINQIENVIRLLKKRNTSRRAAIQLFDANDIAQPFIDVPCTVGIQFAIRNDSLDMFTFMRSNDARAGLVHDIFAFTMLQEMIAKTLGLNLGVYRHYAASLHIYTEDIPLIEVALKEGYAPSVPVMLAMPTEDLTNYLCNIVDAEKRIREGDIPDIDALRLSEYWKDVLRMLAIFRCKKDKDLPAARAIAGKLQNQSYRIYLEWL